MILILTREDLVVRAKELGIEKIQGSELKYSYRPIEMAHLVIVQDGFHGPFKVIKSRLAELNGKIFEYDSLMPLIQSHI